MCMKVLFMTGILMNAGLCTAEVVDALPELAERVREAEALFLEIEFITNERMDSLREAESPPGESPYKLMIDHRRTVSQGPLLWTQSHDTGCTYSNQEHDVMQRWMFDGETTRESENRVLANITTGMVNAQRVPRLHRECSMLAKGFPDVPLSTILSGLEAVRAACDDRIGFGYDLAPSVDWEWEALGTEVVNGLSMEHVRVRFSREDVMNSEIDIWLVPERNYFVGKYHWRKTLHGELPYFYVEVTKWNQFEDRLWYPGEVVLEALDQKLMLAKPQRREDIPLMHRKTLTVELKTLTPNYDLAFFQTLDLQDGAAVYEMKDGQNVNSYQYRAPATANLGGWWLPGLLVALILAVLALFLRRRLKRT